MLQNSERMPTGADSLRKSIKETKEELAYEKLPDKGALTAKHQTTKSRETQQIVEESDDTYG